MLRNCCIAISLFGATAAWAAPPTGREAPVDPWTICRQAVDAAETEAGIPDHLLQAISLAETGRWSSERRESVAWPWTVTAQGEGRHLPTKAAALAAVRQLRAQGVENIDVGCMQVNLRHHPDAFPNLETALDPRANAAYAARFLKQRFAASGSWLAAAGSYHSSTPDRHARYRTKVEYLWTMTGDGPTLEGAAPASLAVPVRLSALPGFAPATPPAGARPQPARPIANVPPPPPDAAAKPAAPTPASATPCTDRPASVATAARPVRIDYERTAKLNESFRRRLAGASSDVTPPPTRAEMRRRIAPPPGLVRRPI